MVKCVKCNGTGTLPQYLHIDGGKCFPCNGTGKVKEVGGGSYFNLTHPDYSEYLIYEVDKTKNKVYVIKMLEDVVDSLSLSIEEGRMHYRKMLNSGWVK